MNYSPLSRKAIATELYQRRTIRRSFTDWCRVYGVEPAPHPLLLIACLEAPAHGDIPRLAVLMTPGSAKSSYGSFLFPPWFMAQGPASNIIAASHTTELAEKWGRKVRNLVSEHGTLLGLEMSGDSSAAGRWALKHGGEYYAAG